MGHTAHHLDTVAGGLRHLKMLSPLNEKSPKGERLGYLQAMLYLAPHTLGGGKTLCPHSTPACRDGCLYSAGRGKTPRTVNARLRRTKMFLEDRDAFIDELVGELCTMQRAADRHGMTLAIRLNGTSDIRWEMEKVEGEKTLFDLFPQAIFFDYTRIPHMHRPVPENWKLTFSLADQTPGFALAHLEAGRNVAAIVPDEDRRVAPGPFDVNGTRISVVDGERDDLRFLDPTPALILLRPKGRLFHGGPMVHRGLITAIIKLARGIAA